MSMRGLVSSTFIIAGIVIADQWTKYLALNRLPARSSLPVIKGVFHLTFTRNTGIAFGIFREANPLLLILLTLAILGFLFVLFREFIRCPGFAFLIGGILGNLVDRIALGYTIDFIDFRIWPVFNISDVFIPLGVGLLLLHILQKKETLFKE